MVSDEYDFWLLDLDGTLVDIEPGYVHQVFDEVGDRLGREFSDREAEVIWHGLGGSRNEQLADWNIDVAEFWRVFHDVEDPQARARHTYLYDDAEFVDELDRPVGLVTHCQEYLTEPVLDHLGIADWFDAVVCCDDEVGWKPDPQPVEQAMREMDLLAPGRPMTDGGASGVLAGDGPHDIGAAWNAGLDGIHVERHDPHERGQCVLGDYRIENFHELHDVADFGAD